MKRLIFAVVATALLSCGSHSRYTVRFAYKTAFDLVPNKNPYLPPDFKPDNKLCAGTFVAASGPAVAVVARNQDPSTEVLSEANLSGNFDGFGKRTIHNDSDNTTLTVDVIYHADSYKAAMEKLANDGCVPAL
jgi:hypothetical protein